MNKKRSRTRGRPLPLVRLTVNSGRVMASSAARAIAIESFALPHVPLSQLRWSETLVERFWREHKRCMALLLMLDVTARRWATPLIPSQRCESTRVSFRLHASDFVAVAPHLFVAGSLQMSNARDPFAAAAHVPAFDGVHVVKAGATAREGGFIFLRCDGGEAALASPFSILVDDLEATFRQNAHRLKLA